MSAIATLEALGVAGGLLLFVILLQRAASAYASEFTGDEAAHYISGLMIADYIGTALGHSPIQYLKDYHSHYPLVSIGHWGPVYYFIEAVWILLFSATRGSVLALSAAMTAATALVSYFFVRNRVGRPAAAFVALVFVASPLVQGSSAELMLDIPVAFFCLLATVSYGRYLATGAVWYSILFSTLAAAAMLVKGNAICLALLPAFAVIFGRRYDLLWRRSFWLPAVITGLIAGPWYYFTYGQVAQGFRYAAGIDYTVAATAGNFRYLLANEGWPLLLCAALGLVVAAVKKPQKEDGWLVATAALFASDALFQSIVPAALQDRYLAPMLPAVLILAVWGVRFAVLRGAEFFAAGHVRPRRLEAIRAAAIVALAASFLPNAFGPGEKPQTGMIDAAKAIWQNVSPANPVVLLGTADENAPIAELAMTDPHRPSLFAVRGTRLLGRGGYNDQDYRPRFKTAAEVMAAIDDYAIPLVLVSTPADPRQWEHLRQIEQAIKLYPDRWELIKADYSASPPVRLYRISGNSGKSVDTKRLLALGAPHALQ